MAEGVRVPALVAHRGFAARALENTLAAFRDAVELGVDMIEMDTHETADGEFIVFHDASLDPRTPPWSRLTAGDVHELTGGDGRAPRLETCTAALPRTPVDLEVKTCHEPARLVRHLARWPLAPGSVVSSFNATILRRLHEARCPYPLFLNVTVGGDLTVRESVRNACVAMVPRLAPRLAAGVAVDDALVTRQLVRRFHHRGLRVFVWTVDDPARMERLAEWTIDGLVTNRPDLFPEHLRR